MSVSHPKPLRKGLQQHLTHAYGAFDVGAEESRRAGAVAKLFGYLARKYVDPHLAVALCELFDLARNREPLGETEVGRICRDIAELEAERRGVA